MIWFGMVSTGLVWRGIVDGYCLDVMECKIWISYFKKQMSYGQHMEIWFSLVWLGLAWFGFEWYGAWVIFKCIYMQNFELLAWKTTELWMNWGYLVWFGMVRFGLVWFWMVWYMGNV